MIHYLRKYKSHIRQLVVFGAVGVTAAIINLSIYLPLCHFGIPPLLANIVGFCCSNVSAYLGHSKFTFKRTHYAKHEFIKYFITSLSGLAINSLFIIVLVHILKFHYSVMIYPTLFFTPILTFLASKFWAFKT
jgi:putative flippase GtrA